MKCGKRQYVRGMDKLEAYHKSDIEFEDILYGSDAYYRDHIFHAIRVWLLGVYLLLGANTHITGGGDPLVHQIHLAGRGKPSNQQKKQMRKILKEVAELGLMSARS